MIFRLRYKLKGNHVHCRLFVGPRSGAMGKVGDLVFRKEEFEAFFPVRADLLWEGVMTSLTEPLILKHEDLS